MHLRPDTDYEIRVTYEDPDGGSGSTDLVATTWSEDFPEAELVEVSDRSEPLEITESGDEDGYRVYEPAGGGATTRH